MNQGTPGENGAGLAAVGDNLSLEAVTGLLLRHWRLLVVCLLVSVVVGWFIAWQSPTIWRADALVQVENSGANQPLQEFADFAGDDANTTAEIEVLRSRKVIGKTVDSLNLTVEAKAAYFPYIGEPIARRWSGASGYRKPPFAIPTALQFHPALDLERFAWGGEVIKVDRLDVADELVGTGFVVIARGSGVYDVAAKDGRLVGVGRVGFPFQLDSSWAGARFNIFISELKARPGTMFYVGKQTWSSAVRSLQSRIQLEEKGRQTGLISAAMTGRDPLEIKATLSSVLNNYVAQNVERKSEQAKRSLEFLETQLPEVRIEVQAAEDALNRYKQERSAVDLPRETQNILASVVRAEEELKQIELQQEELSQVYGNAHPSMKSLAERKAVVGESLRSLQSEVEGLPETQQEVLRLTRDLEVATSLYTFLLNKTQELRVFKAGTVGNVRVLDEPLGLDSPVGPQRARILLIAAVLGGLIGTLLVAMKKLLTRRISDSREVEQFTGLSVYCVVPRSEHQISSDRNKKKPGQRPLAAVRPTDLSIEALRSLRTSLHFALMDSDAKNSNCVAFSSPGPGAGKSFVSLNLAWLMGESGMRVVLVDADMRRGQLNLRVSSDASPGLSEVLSGQVGVQEALQDIEGKFSLLATGRKPPNPSELLMSSRFSQLVDELSSDFDFVIIDTPPILAVTDAGIIGSQVAASFLIARAGGTHRVELESSIDRMAAQGIKVTGIVLNDMTKSNSAYGYDAYSYYTYD